MPTCPACGIEGTGTYCSACGASFGTGKGKKGLSGCAIAWIVAVAVGCLSIPILAILAAIAIPNFLNAVERGKQKRTMADIRTVAAALDSRAAAEKEYPTAAEWTDASVVASLLEPTYVRDLPERDAWARPIQYLSDGRSYTLRSLGKDGRADEPPPGGATRRFDNDILFQDGLFTAYPEGSQP